MFEIYLFVNKFELGDTMKRFLLFAFAFLLGSFIIAQDLSAKKFKKPTAEEMLYNSAQGREFWIAVPPNEADGQPLGNTQPISVDIYVTSAYDCEVTLEVPNMGHIRTKKVNAFEVTTFRTGDGETSFDWEIRRSDEVTNKAVRLHSDQPISVYVLSRRNVTSEGYLAIPISACGTDYMHLAYYDFMENISGGEYRGGGFIIVAAEDNTKAFITLKGVGGHYPDGYVEGDRKRQIGESFEVTLQRGQTYAVFGSGKTRGVFDLSGTTVRTSKPVGFISFHKRTLIPSYDLWNGRDNLIEMLPPINRWGKKYATVEYKRNDHGDFFRIIAAEDDTDFEINWYDKVSGQKIKKADGNLKKAGDFWEYLEVDVNRDQPNTFESIKGTSVFEANKPILVMQYSYSADWDNATEFDPFMILVCPVEQFIPGTVFQTPDGASGFNTNWFNIVAVGDTNDLSQPDLKSIELDGEPIWKMESQFIMNQIPTTNLYWAKLPVDPGAHRLTSNGNTKFGGYIYGFSEHDSYGWPAAMAFNVIGEVDTLPPVLTKTDECGNYAIRITELRNGREGDKPKQVDRGIMSIELLEGSRNYDLDLNDFRPWPTNYDWTIYVNVIDDTKDAIGYLMVTDNEGNFTLDTLTYNADSLSLDPELIDFGLVRMNTAKQLLAVVTNEGEVDVEIREIKLFENEVYKIISGIAPPEFTMAPGDTHQVWIEYIPTREPLTPEDIDVDSLIVVTECASFDWPIIGQGGMPRIVVSDWDAGAVIKGQTVCKTGQTGKGISIKNTGTDTLRVTNILNMAAPFELSDPYTPVPEFIVLPGQEIFLEDVCFTPDDTVSYLLRVEFECNATGPDNIAILEGRGIIPGPYITNMDWEERRVLTVNDGEVKIGNDGNTAIYLTEVNLGDVNDPNFKITGTVPNLPTFVYPKSSNENPKEVRVLLQFTPQEEFAHSNTVVPVFESEEIEPGSVVGQLDGFGILPKITVEGYKWDEAIMLGETSPEEGYVTISSVSETADLWIESIAFFDPAQNDYFWKENVPQKFTLNRGESIQLPVRFTPDNVGNRIETVRVMSDAVTGPEPIVYAPSDTLLEGVCISEGIVTDSLDFGMILTCDNPQSFVTITNTSEADYSETIERLEFVDGDEDAFEILTQFPQEIQPKMGTVQVDVIFHPSAPQYYSALYKVYTTIGNEFYILFEGTGYDVPVALNLKKWTVQEQNAYNGKPFAPGQTVPIPVTSKCPNYPDAEITAFSFDIVYDKDWMRYANNIKKGSGLDNTWNVTATETYAGDGNNKLTVVGSGTTPIDQNIQVAEPFFTILLSDSLSNSYNHSFIPWLENLSFGDRDECLVISDEPGYVSAQSCVLDMRNIIPSDVSYSFSKIEPNPVTSDEVAINFSLGMEANTLIEVFNSNGELIRTLINDVKDKGHYTLTFDIRDFSSGVYHIRINSGPYQETQKLLITR
jgi:hypothetical protein